MYLETIAKTPSQKFKKGQVFSSPIWDGIWKVVAVADKRIAVVRIDK